MMKKTHWSFFILILLSLNFGCSMKQSVDLLVINGRIYSVDSVNSSYEAMAIRDGVVVAMGTTADLSKRFSPVLVEDAGGRYIFPGFIDAHCHFWGLAQTLQYIDLTNCGSFDEVLERVNTGKPQDPGQWIVGRGWDQTLWSDRRFPDNTRLNQLYPDRPVMLVRIDGHSVLANDEALRRAGIGTNHPFGKGEVEIRNGRLTGILGENAADRIRAAVPVPDEKEMTRLLTVAQQRCLDAGLTGVGDAGLEMNHAVMLDTLIQRKVIHLNIYGMLSPTADNFRHFVVNGPYRNDRLQLRSIKIYADGSLGSRSALLKHAYADAPGHFGILTTPPDTIQALCEMALKHGYQVNSHCIGDSACKMILDIYATFLKGKNDLRWRIEHAQVVDPADFELFGRYNIIPSVQATHATSDMRWAEERLGPERIKGAYAYRDLMLQNGWIPNGTDFPIEQIDPLLTFYAAVSRQDLKGEPAGGWFPGQRLTREEALRSVTLWAARANFQDKECGSLELGKYADFVMLDNDIMKVPTEKIPATRVLKTYIRGVQVAGEK